MDTLDLIEKRIATLESEILPQNETFDHNKSQTIIDLLSQTQTMISSALSCRHLITTTIESLSNLHDHLDPYSFDNELMIETKRQYVLETMPEIQERLKVYNVFKELIPYINSEYLIKCEELTDKLEQLTADNLVTFEHCRQVTNQVLNALERYNCIMTSIKIIFSQIDRVVSDLENAQTPNVSSIE